MNYKQHQAETRQKLKPKLIRPSPKHSEPLNLGIKEFKRANKDTELIAVYKRNAWASLKPES